jgi:hypothetical protein
MPRVFSKEDVTTERDMTIQNNITTSKIKTMHYFHPFDKRRIDKSI